MCRAEVPVFGCCEEQDEMEQTESNGRRKRRSTQVQEKSDAQYILEKGIFKNVRLSQFSSLAEILYLAPLPNILTHPL